MESKSAGNSGQSNPFTFCFVEETGGHPDKRTQLAVRSHAAREVRRRRRLEQQKQLQELYLASKIGGSKDLAQVSSGHPKRQRSHMLSLVGRPIGSDYRCEDTQNFDEPLARQMLHQEYSPLLSTSMGVVFDPFASMAELSPLLSSSYSNDVNAIKSHGKGGVFFILFY